MFVKVSAIKLLTDAGLVSPHIHSTCPRSVSLFITSPLILLLLLFLRFSSPLLNLFSFRFIFHLSP